MSNETLVTKVANATQYVGSSVTVGAATKQYWGYSLDEWSLIGIFFGMAMAAGGFLTNLYFKQQHLNLARTMSRADPDE